MTLVAASPQSFMGDCGHNIAHQFNQLISVVNSHSGSVNSITSISTKLAGYANSIASHARTIRNHGVRIAGNASAIGALKQKCATLEGTVGAQGLKIDALKAGDVLQNQTIANLQQRLDQTGQRVNDIQNNQLVQVNANNVSLENRVRSLENSDQLHQQTLIKLNEAQARIAQLEQQNQVQARRYEEEKGDKEKLQQNVDHLTARLEQMQELFEALSESVKAKQKEDSALNEQLRQKVVEQETTMTLLSAGVKKAHLLGGEILPAIQPSGRAERFKARREKSLEDRPLAAREKKIIHNIQQ